MISYHIISYHIISYHIISYHIISYHIISYHIISYHIISYHIISYHIISYHIISYHIISYHIISYHIISYHIISYHIISYHIISYISYCSRQCNNSLLLDVIAACQHGKGGAIDLACVNKTKLVFKVFNVFKLKGMESLTLSITNVQASISRSSSLKKELQVKE